MAYGMEPNDDRDTHAAVGELIQRLDTDDGMPVDRVVNLDNVTLVRTALLAERITTLDSSRMAECCTALAAATDC